MRKQRRIWRRSSFLKRELWDRLLCSRPRMYSHHKILFVSYMQTSGYKPAPLDLNHVKLTPNQNTLVERLAENGHNVWARDRVRQGWTYSIVQVSDWRGVMQRLFSSLHLPFLVQDIVNRRNPRLVPYNLLDEKTKKTNRDTVCSAVRTLIGYGYNIEPPDQESSKFLPAR